MRIGQKGYLRSGIALGVLASALGGGVPAWAQVTLNGPPIQVTPYVSEPGVPTVTITPGSTNPLGGDTDPNGGGAGGSTGTGTSTSAGQQRRAQYPAGTVLGRYCGLRSGGSRRESVGVGSDLCGRERMHECRDEWDRNRGISDATGGVPGWLGNCIGSRPGFGIADRSGFGWAKRPDNGGYRCIRLSDAGEHGANQCRRYEPNRA